MAEERIVNGLNVAGWFQAINEIKDKPDLAKFRFRAHNTWVNAVRCRTFIKDFYGVGREDTSRMEPFVLEADEPPVLLGGNHGPNATEAALYALATCLNTTFMYHASAHGVKVEDLELDLEGDLDLRGVLGISKDVRNGFQNIRVTFKVRADAPREKIAQLCELAQKRSPVFDSLTNPVPVSAKVEIR